MVYCPVTKSTMSRESIKVEIVGVISSSTWVDGIKGPSSLGALALGNWQAGKITFLLTAMDVIGVFSWISAPLGS